MQKRKCERKEQMRKANKRRRYREQLKSETIAQLSPVKRGQRVKSKRTELKWKEVLRKEVKRRGAPSFPLSK